MADHCLSFWTKNEILFRQEYSVMYRRHKTLKKTIGFNFCYYLIFVLSIINDYLILFFSKAHCIKDHFQLQNYKVFSFGSAYWLYSRFNYIKTVELFIMVSAFTHLLAQGNDQNDQISIWNLQLVNLLTVRCTICA